MFNPPVVLYRFGNWMYRNRIPVLPKLASFANRLIFGCWVPSSATLGKNVSLGYWGIGIVLHSNCSIGSNTLVSQNVTVGKAKKNNGIPRIGSRVYIGPGAVISGAIEVGDGSVVGANSFVNHSVPAGVVVAGAPAKILRDTKPGEVESLIGLPVDVQT